MLPLVLLTPSSTLEDFIPLPHVDRDRDRDSDSDSDSDSDQ